MPALALDATEARLLGVLIEKETTTPDAYPLSLAALQTGANQKSNREPKTSFTLHDVEHAVERLRRKSLVSTSHAAGARVEKFKHLAGSTWELSAQELAIVAELMLRGAQQPGELRGRASRMTAIESLPELDALLDGLRQRGFVQRLEPLPGSRAARWDQVVAGPEGTGPEGGAPAPRADADGSAGPNRTPVAEGALPIEDAAAEALSAAPPADDDVADRVEALEREVAELRRMLDELTS